MVAHGQQVFYIEYLQPTWLARQGQRQWWKCLDGLGNGLVYGLLFGSMSGLLFRLDFGLIIGLVFGLLSMLSHILNSNIILTEVVFLSWSRSRPGLMIGIGFGLFIVLMSWLEFGLFSALIGGLFMGLVLGIGLILLGGLKGSIVEGRSRLNEGICRSLRNALVGGTVGGLGCGLMFGLFLGVKLGWTEGLGFGLLSGLREYGGRAVAQHLVLRWLLWWRCAAPWNFAAFLSEAQRLNIVTRVGGGFRFYHRELQEHFASDEQPQPPYAVASILGPDGEG